MILFNLTLLFCLLEQLLYEARSKSIEILHQFINKRIPGATLSRQINNTIDFTLPYSQKPNFEDFFKALEKSKQTLDIASYGISDTTLEEIFLSLTTRDEEGQLQCSLNNTDNKVAEAVSSIPMMHTLSGSLELNDRDSGVAVELDTTSSKQNFVSFLILYFINWF